MTPAEGDSARGDAVDPLETVRHEWRGRQCQAPATAEGVAIDMKAITVQPHTPGSSRFDGVPEPDLRDGSVLVDAIAVGVCGTDVEIVEGKYGWAPPGKARLVLGHESLGRVVEPGPTGPFREGDFVVDIVRRPDPVPCPNKRHWYKAGQALAQADATWLARLLSRRERPEQFRDALHRQPDDIKVVIQFAAA